MFGNILVWNNKSVLKETTEEHTKRNCLPFNDLNKELPHLVGKDLVVIVIDLNKELVSTNTFNHSPAGCI